MGLKLCSCLQGGVVELKLCDLKLMAILDPKARLGEGAREGGREGRKGGLAHPSYMVSSVLLPLLHLSRVCYTSG